MESRRRLPAARNKSRNMKTAIEKCVYNCARKRQWRRGTCEPIYTCARVQARGVTRVLTQLHAYGPHPHVCREKARGESRFTFLFRVLLFSSLAVATRFVGARVPVERTAAQSENTLVARPHSRSGLPPPLLGDGISHSKRSLSRRLLPAAALAPPPRIRDS